jgi:hypothetical protein
MKEVKEEATQSLFDKLWDLTEELKKLAQKPIVMRKLKRRLSSARDNAIEKRDAAIAKLEKCRENISNVESYDINTILACKAEIREHIQSISDIKEEYLLLFGKEMREEEE